MLREGPFRPGLKIKLIQSKNELDHKVFCIRSLYVSRRFRRLQRCERQRSPTALTIGTAFATLSGIGLIL
jgi:hypothetical protein